MSGVLQQYKAFVRKHPSLVQNGERLLHWLVWNPERFSGSEYAYESFNAAVGLLGIYNDSILTEHPGQQQQEAAKWAFWLAAVEQVQTLLELRAIHLEERGKMSRYGPLIGLEVLKCVLRMALWRSSKCTLAMEEVHQEDQEQHECQDQLKELLEALMRLRQRYNFDPATAPTPEHMQYNAHLAHASAVRAAAVAPHRPPAACAAAVADVQLPALQRQQQEAVTPGSSTGAARCAVCGSTQEAKDSSSSSSCSTLATDQQQQLSCKVCGRALTAKNSSSSSSQPLPGLTEITPVDAQLPDAGASASQSKSAAVQHTTASGDAPSSSGAGRRLQGGWWHRMTSAAGLGSSQKQQQDPQQCGSAPAGPFAGALPGSWGPGLRPYPALSPRHSKAEDTWQQQHQQQHPLPWTLSHRDGSIGRSVMVTGEFVHVVKPLVYVVLLKRYGLSSWKPWLTMLALDAASGYGLHTGHAILMRSNASKWPGGSTLFSLALLRSLSSGQWTPGEQQELLSRRVQLLRYLLRSPCYTAFTRRLLLKAVAGSRWVPGLSQLAEFAFSMIEGMQSYYTYVES